VNAISDSNPDVIKRLHPYHCILLAKNNTGRVNLYKLVSDSHIKYFQKKPRIPKSELMKYREGLIVGSACVAGELFQALLEQRSPEQIARIVEFYDYLEIQPRDNNAFLLEEKNRSRYPEIQTEEDLLDLNRQIVRLGEAWNKPVVATCDVHFMDPEDKIYRTIIQDSMGMTDEDPADLYLRTTDEMLEEFAYLGADKCREVVVTNSRKIADMIDVISPVRPDKCAPVIPHSDETLRRICYDKAHSMYGDPLPSIVEERLDRELNSIISNGYSVMYIIAQKLVWKSVEDGYLVGSRGSVGSSFVATMAGITEVNPLPPHYYCPSCHFSDFSSPEVLAYAGKSGIDMPPRICPRCGKQLKKDGFDIPFETFLGFKGDKEPDIDLNFSGEYQAKAHKYTEVIFGHGQTFKAGTISTVAEKTAYGYVRKYFEKQGIHKRNSEIERLLQGCTGIRRSTGQHPGGIVVLPLGEDINSFTPVQRPANDMTTDITTTHFDYHSIDHNLLKLDILGHDDPTMVRMLQDLTGIDPLTIPLDDPDVMSLFSSTKALGITTEENGGIDVGSLGIPEFGTKFVMGMLDDTRPTTMSELVRISGLSHGTDVWLGNAQSLIQEGKAVLSTCICTRDDIMSYLIGKGVEKSMAFKTMESVRKGKGLKPEMKEAMLAADVPDWYIDSCLKIKYMFPRAHAAAYVMMALRIAYCKVHEPLAYYAAYFSIRLDTFNYELMCQGKEKLLATLAELQALEKPAPKDLAMIDDMILVREFYARGFSFTPIDIFQAGSRTCKIVDGKIMPCLTSIDGMGEKAADAVVEAAKDGPFLSREDFYNRTKVPRTVVDKMNEMGLLGDLPETSQISIFDLGM
jgi:DNA polymerase-3 subunit alpha (Gram-positive type)